MFLHVSHLLLGLVTVSLTSLIQMADTETWELTAAHHLKPCLGLMLVRVMQFFVTEFTHLILQKVFI